MTPAAPAGGIATTPAPARLRALGLAATVAGAALSLPSGLHAQGVGLTTGSNQPVVIEAEKGVEWRQKEQIYLAKGNAIAEQGKTKIRADILAAHYRKAESGNQIYKVTATGGVKITTEKETITAEKAVYLVDRGLFTLTGNNLKIAAEKQTVTARDRIVYNSKTRVARVVGDAVVIEEDKKVRADRFVAYMKEDDGGKNSLSKVDAVGNVVITTKTEVLRGDRGDYDGKTKVATLTGNVKLTRGDNQLNGEKAIVNLESGVSRMVGRVQGVFIPREGEEKERQQRETRSIGRADEPARKAADERSKAPRGGRIGVRPRPRD